MNYPHTTHKTLYVVTMGLLSGILLLGQVGMAALPNIEPVTFLILIYTLVYGRQVFFIIYAFILIEGMIYGFGIWWISYLYIWTIWSVIVTLFHKNQSKTIWAILAGAYGLSFGALCSIPYLISGGPGAALAYWAAGIPYDVMHCGGNFVITFVLFDPIYNLLKKLRASQIQEYPQ